MPFSIGNVSMVVYVMGMVFFVVVFCVGFFCGLAVVLVMVIFYKHLQRWSVFLAVLVTSLLFGGWAFISRNIYCLVFFEIVACLY